VWYLFAVTVSMTACQGGRVASDVWLAAWSEASIVNATHSGSNGREFEAITFGTDSYFEVYHDF